MNSAPKRFTLSLDGPAPLHGTEAEAQLMRIYWLASGFDQAGATAAVMRWRHASDPAEFAEMLHEITAWAADVTLGKD